MTKSYDEYTPEEIAAARAQVEVDHERYAQQEHLLSLLNAQRDVTLAMRYVVDSGLQLYASRPAGSAGHDLLVKGTLDNLVQLQNVLSDRFADSTAFLTGS